MLQSDWWKFPWWPTHGKVNCDGHMGQWCNGYVVQHSTDRSQHFFNARFLFNLGFTVYAWLEKLQRFSLCTLVTLGRLTDVSLDKNGDSREGVKNKGSVWVEGFRISSVFLTRREITQKPNHLRNKISLHFILFEIFEIWNPANWSLLKTVGRLTKLEPYGDWGLLVKWNLGALPTFHSVTLRIITFCTKREMVSLSTSK